MREGQVVVAELNRRNLKERAVGLVPLLSVLAAQEQSRLIDAMLLSEHKAGESILQSNAPGRDILFVVDGSVDVKRSSIEGREVIVSRLGVGEILGEIAFLTHATRSADVVAAEDCMLLTLHAEDFDRLLSSYPEFNRAVLTHLANRVAAASTRVADLALLDVYCRVFKALRTLGRPLETGVVVLKDPPTHKELAAMVGTSREMVTRALTKLKDDGLVETDNVGYRLLGSIPGC